MPMRSVILIGLAVLLAGATALIARSFLSEPAAPQQVVQTAAPKSLRVLVAARPLPLGMLLTAKDFAWQSWPDDRVHDSYLVEGKVNPEDFVGHVVRLPLLAGEPVTPAALVAPGAQGFLAAALTPGMRAVTVSVNQTSGVAGFLLPGDRVDLILNHSITTPAGDTRRVSETVVKNLRILAVDTRTNSLPAADGSAPQPQLGKTVTLEATPKIAEKISLAGEIGNLTLALRSLAAESEPDGTADPTIVAPPDGENSTYTWDAEVSRILPAIDPASDKVIVNIKRGSESFMADFPKEKGK